MSRCWFVVLVALIATSALAALETPQEAWNPRAYVCPRALTAPVIDGRLDEECWRAAPLSGPFVDIRGAKGPAPRFGTIARMLWDDDYFYIGAELEEPQLRATLTERDAVIFRDNDFEVFVDPDGDCHHYAELEVSALNTVWDLLLVRPYRDGGPALDGWDIRGLRTAAFLDGTLNDDRDTDRGWSVEIAIPWRALKECAGGMSCPPRPDDTWRVNLSRVQWPLDPAVPHELGGEDNWVWSPQGLVAMHYPERWGFVTFSDLPAGAELPRAGIPQHLVGGPKFLAELYYAQKRFAESYHYFATTLSQLTLPGIVPSFLDQRAMQGDFAMQATAWQFEARLKWGAQIHHVDQTGRFWITEK
jgi:hypothetical protein